MKGICIYSNINYLHLSILFCDLGRHNLVVRKKSARRLHARVRGIVAPYWCGNEMHGSVQMERQSNVKGWSCHWRGCERWRVTGNCRTMRGVGEDNWGKGWLGGGGVRFVEGGLCKDEGYMLNIQALQLCINSFHYATKYCSSILHCEQSLMHMNEFIILKPFQCIIYFCVSHFSSRVPVLAYKVGIQESFRIL